MAERKKGMSAREYWASKTGLPKEQYKYSEEGRAVSKIKDYYEEEKKLADEEEHRTIDRLKEDLQRVLRLAGIAKTRAEEDYIRNMERLKENKETDVEDLNYYVKTQSERTEEDASTNLRREAQRFDLEQYKLNQTLASKNLVFSGMKGVRGREQGLIDVENKENVLGIETEKKRSFEDIKRYEFTKNREIETTFERGTQDEERTKIRGIEDIDLGVEENKIKTERGIEDADIKEDLLKRDFEYAKDTDVHSVQLAYDQARQSARQG